MNYLNRNKGVTLIALIIVIIIMIILTGVTVNTFIGDNGLFSTTKKAAFQEEIKEIKDAYKNARAEFIIGKKNLSTLTLEDLHLENSKLLRYFTDGIVAINNGILLIGPNASSTQQAWLTEMEIANGGLRPSSGSSNSSSSGQTGEFSIRIAIVTQDEIEAQVGIVPTDYFTYEEASNLLMTMTGTSTIEDATVAFVNIGTESSYTTYEEMCEALGLTGYSAEQSIAAITQQFLGVALSVQELAAYYYSEETTKSLTIDGVPIDITEIPGLIGATVIKQNGTFSATLTINGSSATGIFSIAGLNEIIGKYVYYNYDGDHPNSKWIVLYSNQTYGVQLISAETLTNITFNPDGFGINWSDSTMISMTDLDGDGVLSEVEKIIFVYNNMVDFLNQYCHNYINTNYADYARCVGSNPLCGTASAPSDTTSYFSSSSILNYSGTWFDIYNNRIKTSDSAYESDEYVLDILNKRSADNSNSYILNSRDTSDGRARRILCI